MKHPPGIIDHRYRVIRPLGEGLTGEVYLVQAEDTPLALKLLKPFDEKGLEDDSVSAFKFEFGLLKDLRHPHVVGVHEFGFDEALGRFYFTEEYIEGAPIEEYTRSVSVDVIAELFIQAIRGLQAIHRARILHGDLKGSNLLVIEEGSGPMVKIIDLGLADPRFGFTAGTPSTMAPEKITGDTVDERSDLYSLGVTFYALFTGENPFACEDYRRSYEAQLTLRPPPVTRKNPAVPFFWNEIFNVLLEKNPANRYRGCEELLEAIDFARPQGLGEKTQARPWSPERWIERTQPLEELLQKIQDALVAAQSPSNSVAPVFLILGERGVGKSRTLQEIRYRLQMEKWKVLEWRPDRETGFPLEGEFFSLWVVDDWMRLEASRRDSLLQQLAENRKGPILMVSGLPNEQAALAETLKPLGREAVTFSIPPFSREELEDFLLKTTGQSEIPPRFLNGLWENTRGNPRQVAGLLEQFVKQRKLVDPRGYWHLGIFNEEGIDFNWLPQEIPQIDQALLTLPPGEHVVRGELWIQRSDELLQKNLLDEVGETLANAEAEIGRISDLSAKLRLRAKLYEKFGYRAIRTGHWEEAHRFFEKALTLLEEIDPADEVLSIRLNNFLAWVFCKEGRIDQGIRSYVEQQERWEKLPLPQREKILNNELGFAYLLKGDLANAIPILENAMDFYATVRNGPYQMKNLYNLAEAYLRVKRYPEAIDRYLEAAEEARFQKNFELLLRIYNGIGNAYHLQEKFEEGCSYYERALDLARYIGDLTSASGIAQNIGSNLSERGDLKRAEEYLDLAVKMLKKLPELNAETKYFYCRALLERGDLYRKRRMFDEALGLIHEAHQLAYQESFLEFFRFWVLHTQCRIEKDRGQLDKLQHLTAELLSLADDPEKQELCQEFLSPAPDPTTVPETSEGSDISSKRTRVQSFRPH